MSTRRILRRSILAALLSTIAAGAQPATADEKPQAPIEDGPLLIAQLPARPKPTTFELQYKLKRGDVLRYEVTDRASFNTTIEQSTMATQTKTVTVKALKVTDVLPNGNIEFMSVLERVHMVNKLPEKDPVQYDSDRDTAPPPGFEDLAKTIGVPLVAITMTPHGKVMKRDWKVPAPLAEDEAPVAVHLPDRPVAIGDTWDEPFELKVAMESQAIKLIQTRRHHKLVSVSSGIATIEVKYQVLTPIDAYVEYQLLQRLTEGEVKFDIEAGRLVSQQMELDKRILGFAGPTSSTHYIRRMEEKLLKSEPKVAGKPTEKSTTSKGPANRATPTRSANRPGKQQGTRAKRR